MAEPFVHLFKTAGGYYIYDVNTDMILEIAPTVYQYLSHRQIEPCDEDTMTAVQKMKADGFLSDSRIKKMRHPATECLKYYLQRKMRMLILQLTQNCNLRCNYCPYTGNYNNRSHNTKAMSLETAKRGIDFFLEHAVDSNEVHIGFYGGEPLLEFDLLKACVEYAEIQAEGKDIYFNLTSNGTLLRRDVVEFFEKHRVSLSISLDGPAEVQNKNRRFANSNKDTFDTVFSNVKRIRADYPEYYKDYVGFSMVVDPQNNFDCVNEFIETDEIFTDAFLSASLISRHYLNRNYDNTDDFVEKQAYEAFKALLYELKRLDKEYVSPIMLRKHDKIREYRAGKYRTGRQHVPEITQHSGPCIPGTQRLFVSVEGNLYPCEKASESSEVLKMGNLFDGIDFEKAERLLNVGRVSERQCTNCWAYQYCTACAIAVDQLTDLATKAEECERICRTTEDMMQDYCALMDLGNQPLDNSYFEQISEKALLGRRKYLEEDNGKDSTISF